MAYYRKIAPTVALELTIGIINYTEVAVNVIATKVLVTFKMKITYQSITVSSYCYFLLHYTSAIQLQNVHCR